MFSKLVYSVLLVGILYVPSYAQLAVDLSVDVSESDGIYTYIYTLQNSEFSFQHVNTLLLTTGKGAEITNIAGPEGWFADYEKDALPTFQAAFIAGDGTGCGDGEAAEIAPGSTQTFTIESTWAPDLQDFNLGRLISDPVLICDWEGGTIIDGMIASPSIRPDVPMFDPCDFDQDGDCDLRDINNLASTIALGDHDATYDLTSDLLVNKLDLDAFLVATNRINGDADFNGSVAFADFLTLSGNFGQDNAFWSDGDFDADGEVAFGDFLILSGNFGQGEVAMAAVPEPQSQGIAVMGIFGMLLLRSRRRSLQLRK